MGWWSKTILGGDQPLDILGSISDVIYRESKNELTNSFPVHKREDFSLYPLEGITENADIVRVLRKTFEDHLDECIYVTNDYDKELAHEVIGSVVMALGAEVPKMLMTMLIEDAENDSWAKTDEERKGYVNNFIAALKCHEPGKIWTEQTEGLFDQMNKQPIVEVISGSVWKHTNGNQYTVLMIANEHTQYPDKYPVTVVYKGENGRIWARKLSDWHRSMTKER